MPFLRGILSPIALFALLVHRAICGGGMSDGKTAYVAQLLDQNGAGLRDSTQVEFVERGLTHVYRIGDPKSWYLKFTPLRRRSVGAFYPKRLWSPTTSESQQHGIDRRSAARALIHKINSLAGETLLAPPHPLDQNGNIWEFITPRSGEMEHPELGGSVATGWLGIDATPNPHHDGSAELWHPSSYSPSNLRELSLHLRKISDLAAPLLGEELYRVLAHERDHFLNCDLLVTGFLKGLALGGFSLEEALEGLDHPHSEVGKRLAARAKERLAQVGVCVEAMKREFNLPPDAGLEELKDHFYKENKTRFLQGAEQWELDRTPDALRLFHCGFTLEREGLCSEKTRFWARRLAQCAITSQLATDTLNPEGGVVRDLLELLVEIAPFYSSVEQAPKGLVHGNAHPHEFLQDEGGKWTLGGCETLHVGSVYRDIAEEYLRKLVRDYVRGNIEKGEALEKIRAVLIPGWLDAFWPDLMGYPVVDFAQELETLIIAYSMDSEKVDLLNLTITPTTYLEEMRHRLTLEKCYRVEFLPELMRASP